MLYRPEIDGLRALAVVPVILFHAGFELFSGGFIGVDVFFVISGYLITTIIVDDIENDRFSVAHFYERRARRILPPLILVALCSTIAGYWILYPTVYAEYSRSLIAVSLFLSNIFFWKKSDYFATEAELTPLLHTWSLAVEEQFYVLFPIFFLAVWRFGKSRTFWAIVIFAGLSLLLSEFAWRVRPVANFYLAPTRAWELLAGSIAAFLVQKRGVRGNHFFSTLGLAVILIAVFFYDRDTPTPSIYSLLPVIGVVLVLLFSDQQMPVTRLLSTRIFVGVGLVSYSAYLWHQPLLAFARFKLGVNLDLDSQILLCCLLVVLSFLSWRYIERPFRMKSGFSSRFIFGAALTSTFVLVGCSILIVETDGASWRFRNYPEGPPRWPDIKCLGTKQISPSNDPLPECLGIGNKKSGDIYLVGDSHAAQLIFALERVAEDLGKTIYFIKTEEDDKDDYPQSFFTKDVSNDRIFDYLVQTADRGDVLVTSLHRGKFNDEKRDSHIKENVPVEPNKKSQQFEKNFRRYAQRFREKGITTVLVKDGPLLNDNDTMLQACMHRFLSLDNDSRGTNRPCSVSLSQDLHTRKIQSDVFERIAEQSDGAVVVFDPLPILYDGKNEFSPISIDGRYLMMDRHHLTQAGSLLLAPHLLEILKRLLRNGDQ